MRLRDLPKDPRGRPIAAPLYGALVDALATVVSDRLGHLDRSRILIVTGAARRESSASIRPLTFGGDPPKRERDGFIKPTITMLGEMQLYEIALRPKFFFASTFRERLRIFAHELWHISPDFDGTLASDRRHEDRETSEQIEREVLEIVERFLSSRAAGLAEDLLGYAGELRLPAWLSRPPSREPKTTRARLEYDERDLYLSIVDQTAP